MRAALTGGALLLIWAVRRWIDHHEAILASATLER